jgi:hypothetical protein
MWLNRYSGVEIMSLNLVFSQYVKLLQNSPYDSVKIIAVNSCFEQSAISYLRAFPSMAEIDLVQQRLALYDGSKITHDIIVGYQDAF